MISKLWRGDAALSAAFWLWGVLGGLFTAGCALTLLFALVSSGLATGGILFFALLFATGGIGYLIVVSTGIWRSASNYSGDHIWPYSARLILVLVWCFATAVIALMADEVYQPPSGPVSSRIAADVRDKNALIIDLSTVADFPWTEFLVFAPYVARDEICRHSKISGLHCWWIAPSSIKEGDYFFVFLEGDRLAHHEHHSHWKNGEIEGILHPVTVFHKGTIFEVVRPNTTTNWFSLRVRS